MNTSSAFNAKLFSALKSKFTNVWAISFFDILGDVG